METSGTVAPGEFRSWIHAGEARRAGEWLVRSHASEVLGLCTAMVRDRHIAEDLTQEIFARAFSALDGFRGDASVRTWLLQIARNRCIDHLRAQQRDPWGGRDADPPDPDEQTSETPLPPDLMIRRAEVETALGELSEGERAIIVLRFQHGLGYPELAAAFGLREATVRMRVSRALRRMRLALETPVMASTPASLAAASMESEMVGGSAEGSSKAFGAPAAPRKRSAAGAMAPQAEAAPPQPKRRMLDRLLRRDQDGAPAGPPPASAPAPAASAPAPSAPPTHALSAFFSSTVSGTPAGLRARLAQLLDQL